MKAEEIIKKFKLDKTTWTFKGFHGLPFTFYYIGYGPLKWCNKYYGDQCKKSMFFVTNNYVQWYWPDDDMQRLRKLLIKNVNKNPDYLRKMRNDWEKKLRVFDKVLAKIERTILSKQTNKQLFNLYDEFLYTYMDEFGIVMTIQDAFSMYSSEFLEPTFMKVLTKHGKAEQFTNYYTQLLNPVEDSFISLEKKSRLKILKEAKMNSLSSKKIKNMLEEHQKKFFWIRNNYAKQPVLNVKFFKDEIKKMDSKDINPDKKLAKMKKHLEEIKENKKKLIKELKLSKETINLIRITENFSYIQDERKKYVLIANHYERLFIKEISRRKKIPEKFVEYLVYPETKEKEFDLNKLKKRIEYCVCIQNNKGFYMFEGKKAKNVHQLLFEKKEKKNVEIIKGLAASKGKAKGIVKIVLKTHDLINFRKGDVLVTSMTRPEMVVAMEKAAAIVTDEGGITSHAAIISRELSIPCIIATKIATKTLMDGDYVDVNANEGIIKVIKHK